MINVLINGINGRMGQEVLKAVNNSSDFRVCCGVDKESSNSNIPIYNNVNLINEKVDIIIDFSIPNATMNILEYAKDFSIPIVIATTGFTSEQLNKFKEYSNFIPIFRSGNMSYEVNIMADIVAKLSTQLRDSDIEIIESHHRNKIDSPSGTALIFADSINEALGNKMEYQYNRHDVTKVRPKNEIGIHSIRGGTEVGKHTVIFMGENESFEITHTVTSRSIFANGALKAARYLISKPAGFYNMKNLI